MAHQSLHSWLSFLKLALLLSATVLNQRNENILQSLLAA